MNSPDDFEAAKAELSQVKNRLIGFLVNGEFGGEVRDLLNRRFIPIDMGKISPVDFPRIVARKTEDLRVLAVAYSNPASEWFHSGELLERLELQLDDVLDYFNPETESPRSANWYYWLIAIPSNLGPVGLMLGEHLDPELRHRLVEALEHELKDLRLEGSNASAEARNHLYLALMTGDPDRLARAAAHGLQTLAYSTDYGVREDYSYLYHGRIPYAGTYGKHLIENTAQFLYFLDGTRWTACAEQRDLLANLLLEHVRWLVVGRYHDLHISGRHQYRVSSSNRFLEAALLMTQVDSSRREELRGMAAAMMLDGLVPTSEVSAIADQVNPSEAALLSGFRYWYSSEMGVYKGSDFHVGFRQFSRRVQDYEFLNLEGEDGWNLAYGFTTILRRGDEWYQTSGHGNRDRVAAIDMRSLPGTTSRYGVEPENPKTSIDASGYSLNWGSSSFSGGAGWQTVGVAGFILEPVFGDFVAKKSLHFFPQGFWAIGSGIRSLSDGRYQNQSIRTTLLQWVSMDAVQISGDRIFDEVEGRAECVFEDVHWFFVDRIGCIMDEPSRLHFRRIENVITVWIEHGGNPEDGTYAYAVLPNSSLAETRSFADNSETRPISASPRVHAVRMPDTDGVAESYVFFEAGKLEDLKVNRPAIVCRHKMKDGVILAIQNPMHDGKSVEVECTLNPEWPLTRPDEEVTVKVGKNGTAHVDVESTLGRIYRIGFGAGGSPVVSVPREDLEPFHAFTVQSENTPTETMLTLYLPPAVVASNCKLTIRGYRGHLLETLDERNLVEKPGPNTFLYRWNRELPDDMTEAERNLTVNQRSGDFRVYLETPTRFATAYFSVPAFDADGKVNANAKVRMDLTCPPDSRARLEGEAAGEGFNQ